MTDPGFLVGEVEVHGRLILAPMDGFSDLPFRALCRRLGSAMSYTSFVSPAAILAETAQASEALAFVADERPVVFQIFDDDEDRLLQAAQRLVPLGPDIIDVNMGCSARCVAGRGAGAGLLRDPRKVARIISRLSAALPVPVTAKIRLGWDEDSRNYLQVARAIADHGGRLIAVHGRTKDQGYSGAAVWEPIAEIKAAVPVPVIGNGDVRTAAAAEAARRSTGCDAVMIGRGAIGNPWIFEGRDRPVSGPEVVAMIERHLTEMLAFHGRARGVVLFRKHLARYLDRLHPPPETRRALLTSASAGQVMDGLHAVVASSPAPSRPFGLRPTLTPATGR